MDVGDIQTLNVPITEVTIVKTIVLNGWTVACTRPRPCVRVRVSARVSARASVVYVIRVMGEWL